MNNEEPYRDQAERLRQKIEKMTEQDDEALHLPPRSEVHRNKKKKTKWKLKFPLIRLLVLFFILLPITICSIYYKEGKYLGINNPSISSGKEYETVDFERANNSNNNPSKKKEKISQNNAQPNTANETKKKPDLPANQAGKTSTIQPADSVEKTNSATTQLSSVTKQQTAAKIVYHKVAPNETLYNIAITYYQSGKGIKIIKDANHLEDDSILAGQVLKIPIYN